MVDVPVDYERPAASSLFGRAMVSPDLKERMNEVVRRVFSNVHGYWLDYGETDFPNDLGIRFRNDFVKSVLNFDHDINDPVPDDKFFPTNISLLEKLSVDQLLRVIGTLHLYSVSRDYCVRSRNIRSFSNSLNWVFNAYEFPGSASCEWFELAKKITINSLLYLGKKRCTAKSPRFWEQTQETRVTKRDGAGSQ